MTSRPATDYYLGMIATPQKIRKIRESLGVSRVDFGAMLGVNRAAVGHWETGRSKPTRSAQMLLEQLVREKLSTK